MSDVRFELRNERENDYLVTINGKGWKVFHSYNYSENYVRALCQRKTAETGNRWSFTPYAG
jgi:hypothetical protein